MVTLTIEDGRAIFAIEGWHQLWAVKSRLEIPVEHIRGAYIEPDPKMGWFDGWKLIGTEFPHLFRAGLFRLHGEYVFYDVRHPEKTIVVELADEKYRKLIIEVEEPAAVVAKLNAVAGRG